MFDEVVGVVVHGGGELLVLVEVADSDHAVEPVSESLVVVLGSVVVATDELRIGHIIPEQLQVAGQTCSLHLQLLTEPTGGCDSSGGQLREGRW